MPRIRGVLFSFEDTLLEMSPDPTAPLLGRATSPGTAEVLATCFGRYRLGLVCAGEGISAASARATLAVLDWEGWFESVVAPHDLGYAACDPNLLRAAASSMGILPGRIVAVSTDAAMTTAANRAGCRSVRVGEPQPQDHEGPGRHTWTAPALGDIPRVLGDLERAA